VERDRARRPAVLGDYPDPRIILILENCRFMLLTNHSVHIFNTEINFFSRFDLPISKNTIAKLKKIFYYCGLIFKSQNAVII
jgi:hypothetical protein